MQYAAPAFEAKLCPPGELAARLVRLPRPLVFTNGCFDILHRGHVTYLAQARALGASLLVGVNTDASAKRLGKGVDRPVNSLEDRMAVLAAWRGRGVGAAMLEALMAEARRRGLREAYLHSQAHAKDFYARHGYAVEGEEYLEAGIPHIGMRARL